MPNPCSILLTEAGKPRLSTGVESLSDFPPSLWSQIDPASRQQLSQMIAELIRRIRLPIPEKEVCDDETA